MNYSNLKTRVFFVLWAIPLGWWIVNSTMNLMPSFLSSQFPSLTDVHIFPGQILAIALIVTATTEYLGMLSKSFSRNGFWLIYIWIGLQAISYFTPEKLFSFKIDTYILLMVVAAEAFIWGKNTGRWKRASLLFSGTLFLVTALFSLLEMYADPFQKIFSNSFTHPMLSQLGIVTVITAIFMCDSAAYFAGSFFGKHHFSSISPKKTLEGSAAGLVASMITTAIGWHFLVPSQYPIYIGLILGLFIGFFAQIGDLLVSLMKRYFEVKDASNIIPGHGGILDRFDSVFFTAPVINIILILADKIV